jgi:Xaa-Pro aminopeptidase
MMVAHFIYDISETNADLYYFTRFRAPDAFIYFSVRGKKYIALSDLEIDRARKEALVDEVLSLNPYVARAKKRIEKPGQADVIHEILKEQGVKKIIAHRRTSFELADALRKRGYKVEAGSYPFCTERLEKTREEKNFIMQSQRATFAAIRLARDVLTASRIKGRRLVYRGTTLTSERLRTMIEVFLLERNFLTTDTIVSCGSDALDPHANGSGPLTPHGSIIVDIFPRSNKTYYYGDATRTFCRGRASDKLREMYAVVKAGQRLGLDMVRAGAKGKKIHGAITAFFASKGFPTGVRGGRNAGFFHGTGHGLGLEIHEEPVRVNQSDYRLKAGNVISVEPGLYYPGIGGVRIEDLVYVTKDGCEMIGHFPKQLEIV